VPEATTTRALGCLGSIRRTARRVCRVARCWLSRITTEPNESLLENPPLAPCRRWRSARNRSYWITRPTSASLPFKNARVTDSPQAGGVDRQRSGMELHIRVDKLRNEALPEPSSTETVGAGSTDRRPRPCSQDQRRRDGCCDALGSNRAKGPRHGDIRSRCVRLGLSDRQAPLVLLSAADCPQMLPESERGEPSGRLDSPMRSRGPPRR